MFLNKFLSSDWLPRNIKKLQTVSSRLLLNRCNVHIIIVRQLFDRFIVNALKELCSWHFIAFLFRSLSWYFSGFSSSSDVKLMFMLLFMIILPRTLVAITPKFFRSCSTLTWRSPELWTLLQWASREFVCPDVGFQTNQSCFVSARCL